MAKKTVTETTTLNDADIAEAGNNGTRHEDEADPINIERNEALRAKYQYAAKRNKMAMEELEAKAAKKEPAEDDLEKMQVDMVKQMKAQVTIKNLKRMLEDGEGPKNGRGSEIEGLTRELKEAFSYLDKRLDSVTNDKANDRFMAMMQQQAAAAQQAQQQQMQMMMALLTRQDPNAAMTQNMMMKMMDQKASIKDFLPMMAQVQTMGLQQSAELEKSRMGIVQELVLHALTAGEKDWDGMSIMEKANFVTDMLKKGVGFGVDKIKEIRARKYEPGKDKTVENGDKKTQNLLPPIAVNPANPGGDAAKTETAASPGQPPTEGAPAPNQAGGTEDAELKAIISDRVNRMLKIVETEMKLGSDPFVVFEELEKLYFGLPETMRSKIESDENPLMLVQAIEPYADKTILDKITQMAIADQAKADWLKGFHQAVLGIEPEDDDEGEEENDGGDEPEDGGTGEKEPDGAIQG